MNSPCIGLFCIKANRGGTENGGANGKHILPLQMQAQDAINDLQRPMRAIVVAGLFRTLPLRFRPRARGYFDSPCFSLTSIREIGDGLSEMDFFKLVYILPC